MIKMMYEIGEKAIKSIDRECDEYEIYISEGKTTQLDSLKDELNFAKDEIEYGIGIRVLKDNKLGFAFTSDFNKIPEIAKQAIDNSK